MRRGESSSLPGVGAIPKRTESIFVYGRQCIAGALPYGYDVEVRNDRAKTQQIIHPLLMGAAGRRQGTAMASSASSSVLQLEGNICRVVLGKQDVVRMCLVGMLSGEHVLLEDVPGVGKTLLGKALARSVQGDFCRLQFTPDLLPSDIVGGSVFDTRKAEFVFHRGPVFANIVLADEINRAPPRTQSALLEAMSDRQVSVDGSTYSLPNPFMVIATQNPYEYEGTYSLPESQLDRFLIRVSVGYPDRDSEREVLRNHRQGEPINTLEPVLTGEEVIELQQAVRDVKVEESIYDYILDIVAVTRDSSELRVGVSTRGALSLYRAAQAWAMIDGRDYVTPDDVKHMAAPVLAHRVIVADAAFGARKEEAEAIIERAIGAVAAPV